MTAGALEQINDASFEQFSEVLLEGDDPLYIKFSEAAGRLSELGLNILESGADLQLLEKHVPILSPSSTSAS